MNDTTHSSEARYIGKRMPRAEDARLLIGRGTYVDDVELPGMLHVAFVRSQIARGSIRSIDTSAALDLPGVYTIYTAQDLARFKIDMLSFFLSPPAISILPLAADRVAYVGDPVALVIAQDRYVAEDAAGLVVVDYDAEAPVVTLDDAKRGSLVHPGTGSNVAVGMGEEPEEEIEKLLSSAPHLITNTIKHQRIAQSPLETRGVVVAEQGPGELTIYLSCQSPQMSARYIALAIWPAPSTMPSWAFRRSSVAPGSRGSRRSRANAARAFYFRLPQVCVAFRGLRV